MLDHEARVEQHAHRHEEQRGEHVAEGRHVALRLRAEARLPDDEAGEERAERDRHVEAFRGDHRDAEREHEHGQGEELLGARARHALHHPAHHPAAHDPHQQRERARLGQRQRERHAEVRDAVGVGGQYRQDDQRDHGEEVLDDQPPDRDVPGMRREAALVDEHAHEHDGARDRERHAEHEAGGVAPAERACAGPSCDGGHHALGDRARHRDPPHPQELLRMEVHAHAEHEQDHADLGHLRGEPRVGDEARRVRADDQAREHVADEGGQAEALREPTEDESARQCAGERGNDGEVVHGPSLRAIAR